MGQTVGDALATTPVSVPIRPEPNGEAVTFDAIGDGYYTTSEVGNQPLYYYARTSDDGPTPPLALVAPEAVWRYLDDGSNQGTAWRQPAFDDSAWNEGTLPINWRDNHTVLLRASFDITDPDSVDALHFLQHAKHMDHMRVYINGRLVARITEVAGGRVVRIPLNDIALKALKKGRNVLAVTYRHHLRWGSYAGPSGGGLNVTLEMQERE